MQKFGLDNLQSHKHSELELEIIDMQSSALGLAGKKLQLSIQEYTQAKEKLFPKDNKAILLQIISENAYELMLQREFIGFVDGNMQWIQKHYAIPHEAFKAVS